MKTKLNITNEIDKTISDIQDAVKRMNEAKNQLVFEVYRLQVSQLNAKLDALRWVINETKGA